MEKQDKRKLIIVGVIVAAIVLSVVLIFALKGILTGKDNNQQDNSTQESTEQESSTQASTPENDTTQPSTPEDNATENNTPEDSTPQNPPVQDPEPEIVVPQGPTFHYPMDVLPDPTAAIDSSGSGRYVAGGKYVGNLIPLSVLPYNQVTITNGSHNSTKNPYFAYAFLAEKPALNEQPVYAAGYSKVLTIKPVQTLTVNIPSDAKYLYVVHHSNDAYYFPESLVFSNKTKSENTFTLSSWNIGNFSNGGKVSTITDDELPQKQKAYTDYINNRLKADLACFNEFDPFFTTSWDYASDDVLFPNYATSFVGTKNGYQCNAMFANGLQVSQPVQHSFKDSDWGTAYYYISTQVTINGKTVTVVGVHLDFTSDFVDGVDPENTTQIKELLNVFANEERVVMIGDWNCIDFKQYNLLTNAGYTLANTDPDLHTVGKARNNCSLDNIAYKGVDVSDFTCEYTDLSDHLALTCTVTVD